MTDRYALEEGLGNHPLVIRAENDKTSYVSSLFTRLIYYSWTNELFIQDLVGCYIIIGENIARVVKAEGRKLFYKLFDSIHDKDDGCSEDSESEGIKSKIIVLPQVVGEGSVDVLYFERSINTHFVAYPYNEQIDEVFNIFSTEPSRIYLIQNGRIDASFSREDNDLEELLQNGYMEFQSSSMFFGMERVLKKLNNWVCRAGKYDKSVDEPPFTKNIDILNPLGKVWKEYGRVCRHFSALELAILHMHNIPAGYAVTSQKAMENIKNKTDKKNAEETDSPDSQIPLIPHAFLEVALSKGILRKRMSKYVVDPTQNFVFPVESYVEGIKALGINADYHLEYEFGYFVPDYLYGLQRL